MSVSGLTVRIDVFKHCCPPEGSDCRSHHLLPQVYFPRTHPSIQRLRLAMGVSFSTAQKTEYLSLFEFIEGTTSQQKLKAISDRLGDTAARSALLTSVSAATITTRSPGPYVPNPKIVAAYTWRVVGNRRDASESF